MAAFSEFCRSALGQPFKLRIAIATSWQWIFPRPQPDSAHTLLLEVEEDGAINVAPMFDLLQTPDSLLPEAKSILEEWMAILEALHANMKVSIITILTFDLSDGIKVIDAPHWASLWRQLLIPWAFRIEKNVKGSIDVAEYANMRIANPDGDCQQGWTLREVDQVCRHHVAKCFSACSNS